MKLRINDFYSISDIASHDKAAYVEHLSEKQIYDQTLSIPYPIPRPMPTGGSTKISRWSENDLVVRLTGQFADLKMVSSLGE